MYIVTNLLCAHEGFAVVMCVCVIRACKKRHYGYGKCTCVHGVNKLYYINSVFLNLFVHFFTTAVNHN